MAEKDIDKKIEVTQEHLDQVEAWGKKFEKEVIFRTNPMTTEEQLAAVGYVRDRYIRYAKYQAEQKKTPFDTSYNGPELIYFVPSPFVALVIGAFAGAITELGNKAVITIPDMVKTVLASTKKTNQSIDEHCIHYYDIPGLNKQFKLGETGKKWLGQIREFCDGGNRLGGWISYVEFFKKVVKVERDFSDWDTWAELGKISGPRVMLENVCIIADFPTVFKVNAEMRTHCTDGPFQAWSDGVEYYAVNNVNFPAKYINDKSLITAELITKEQNAEVRRVMTDFFGKARYIQESNSEVVHKDDFGTLYRQKRPGDTDLMMVCVVNSTPEPDGSFKDYWLQVDPDAYGGLKTAQAAVASTWRYKDNSLVFDKYEDYVPEFES